MRQLDISRLIKKSEEVFYDNQIGFAAKLEAPIHNVQIDGQNFQLKVVFTSIPEEIIKL